MSAAFHIPLEEPDLITVEEFEDMELPESCKWELVDGQVVSVTFPTLRHGDVQYRIAKVLDGLFGKSAVVRIEYPYSIDTYNKNGADVAAVDPKRHPLNEKRFEGAPELIVEVISPSNSERKLDHLQARCFQAGCQQFWRVYPQARIIKVAHADGTSFTATETVPLQLFDVEASIALDDIFGPV